MDIKKIIVILSLSTLMSFLPGCTTSQMQPEVTIQSDSAKERFRDAGFAKRFQEAAPQNPTAVQSAIEISEKYAKLSEEASALRQENQNLLTQNQNLKDRLTSVEGRLQQAQKELGEANDLLIEMRIELNNWKADILGFRDEMRQSDTEQLRALLKILEVLGGEIKLESAPLEEDSPVQGNQSGSSEDISSTAVSSSSADHFNLNIQETPTLGEPNE